MTPKTAKQRRVMELAPKLRGLNPRNLEWAKQRLFDKFVYASAGTMWCAECGKEWAGEPQVVDVRYECPKCGSKATLKRSRKRKEDGRCYYFTVLDVCAEWQVVRHYLIFRYANKGFEAVYNCFEAVQIWVDADGDRITLARSRMGLMGVCDKWIPTSPMSIKQRSRWGVDPYWINAPIAPVGKVAEFARRNGYTRRCQGVAADVIISEVLSKSSIETMIKCGQYALVNHFAEWRAESIAKYWPSVRIAIRHGYRIKDATMWCDYLDDLRTLGKDLRNPMFVCPKNLRKAHERTSSIIRERRERERKRIEAQRALEANAKYKERWGNLLAMTLSIGNLVARPLQDVSEFLEEGTVMKHCVYSNGYYNRENAIVFSVRNVKDRREATVEYNLPRQEVVQCRGKANTKPERYADIMAMFEANKRKIKECYEARI